MKINVTDLSYSFNNDNETVGTTVSFNGTEGQSYVSATIRLNQEDLDGKNIDDLSKKEITALARAKMADFTKEEG
jgi:hypothetical protein